jgi:hypothetical protein
MFGADNVRIPIVLAYTSLVAAIVIGGAMKINPVAPVDSFIVALVAITFTLHRIENTNQ